MEGTWGRSPWCAASESAPCGCNQRLLADWAGTPRDARALEEAARCASAGFAVSALLSQRELTASARGALARTCMREGYGQLLAGMMDQGSLSGDVHTEAVVFLASRYEDFSRAFPRWLNRDLRTCLLMASQARVGSEAILGQCADGRHRDAPEVRSLILRQARALSQQEGADRDELRWALLSLAGSAALTSSELDSLGETLRSLGATTPAEELRISHDFSVLLPLVGCSRGSTPTGVCLASVRQLALHSGEPLTWSSGNVPFETLAHAGELGDDLCSRVLASTTASLLRRTAQTVCREHIRGRPGMSVALALLVEHSGTDVLDDLPGEAAVACVAELARRGWYALTWAAAVTEELRAVVLDHYQPASALLVDNCYRELLSERLSLLPPVEQDVAWCLLPEWVGTLPGLVASSREVAR